MGTIGITDSVGIESGTMNITEIVKSYRQSLRGFIRKRVKNLDDADDILQDVFFQLAETDDVLHPIENIAGWLFTVTRNKITDLYRKKRPSLLSELSDDESVVNEIISLLFNEDNSPETEYLKTLIWEEYYKALSELPEEQRYVFEMNEINGVAFKELSAETGESVNTLISRKRYAVLHLRKRLQQLYDELLNT